jgi:transposase-like protein
MSVKPPRDTNGSRRKFADQFKADAVQMLLDGHTATSVVDRLGLSGTNLLYRWKREQLQKSGPVASSLDSRVKELEIELRRVERERDILKKALSIFSRSD